MDDLMFYKPCEKGHVFIWSSDTTIDTVAPKGTPCQCGHHKADGKGGGEIAEPEKEG